MVTYINHTTFPEGGPYEKMQYKKICNLSLVFNDVVFKTQTHDELIQNKQEKSLRFSYSLIKIYQVSIFISMFGSKYEKDLIELISLNSRFCIKNRLANLNKDFSLFYIYLKNRN